MKNGLTKLAAGIFASASVLALGACSKTPDIDAKCYVVSNGESASTIHVRDKSGQLMYTSQVTKPAKDGIITGENTFKWNPNFTYDDGPANTREHDVRIVADTKNNSCEKQKEYGGDLKGRGHYYLETEFTGGVTTKEYKPAKEPKAEGNPEHWYMFDVMDGKPLPKPTFAPAGENAIDVSKSQRTPAP